MEPITDLESLRSRLTEQEALFNSLSEQLREAQALAVAKQFEVTKLNHAGFFQRSFGNLRKKQDAAWAEYRSAVMAADELKLTLAAQQSKLDALRAQLEQNP